MYLSFSGACLLPWLPILGALIVFLVVLSLSLTLGLCCLCHGRSQSFKPSGDPDDDTDGIKVRDYRGHNIPLCKDELKNDRCILNWLSSVINTLDSDIVGKKPELHDVLAEFRNELNSRSKEYLADLDKRSVEADGDDDTDDIEMKKKPVIMIEGLIEQILAPSS